MFEILIFFVCAAVIGLMFLFFGYAFFRILLPIWAFFVGLMFGVHGMQNLFGANVISSSTGFIFGLFAGAILSQFGRLGQCDDSHHSHRQRHRSNGLGVGGKSR